MTAIDSSPLKDELNKILNSYSNTREITYSGILHLDKYNLSPEVLVISNERNFISNNTDLMTVTVLLHPSDYIKHILPEHDLLDISLTRHTLGKDLTHRYKAVLISQIDLPPEAQGLREDDMNRVDMLSVEFQLIDKYYYVYRNKTINGVSKKDSITDILGAVMNPPIKILTDGSKARLMLTEGDNTLKRKQMIIEQTKLINLPKYLHNKVGLYNGGVNVYISKYDGVNNICVYPIYRVDKTMWDYELEFIDPGRTVPNYSNDTYIKDGEIYKIACHSVDYFNRGVKGRLDNNAKRVIIEGSLYNRPATTTNSKITVDRKNMEINHQDELLRDGTIHFETTRENIHKATDTTLASKLSLINVVWAYPDINLIRPNVKATFTTVENGKVVKRTCIINKCVINHTNRDKVTIASIQLAFIKGT